MPTSWLRCVYANKSQAAVSAATTPVAAAADEDEETKTKSNGTLNTATTLRGNNELQAVAFAGSSVSTSPPAAILFHRIWS